MRMRMRASLQFSARLQREKARSARSRHIHVDPSTYPCTMAPRGGRATSINGKWWVRSVSSARWLRCGPGHGQRGARLSDKRILLTSQSSSVSYNSELLGGCSGMRPPPLGGCCCPSSSSQSPSCSAFLCCCCLLLAEAVAVERELLLLLSPLLMLARCEVDLESAGWRVEEARRV